MTQDQLKQAVAQAAVDHILPFLDSKSVIGVGTGSTANCFIDALARHKMAFDGAVASSEATAARLRGHGIPVYDLNAVDGLEFYVDGADESDEHLHLIKGGGAALTREKIVAAVAKTFICIADGSKLVPVVSVASNLVQWVLLGGIILINTFPQLLLFGIVLFAMTTLFSVITLPVEYDASNRALAWMKQRGIVTTGEYAMSADALKWAARTYLVAAIGSIGTLLYYVMMYTNRRD